MQVLTPSGYKAPVSLANGDELCAFDAVTGAPIINTVENIDFVDHAEWCRWWQCEETVPAYNWVRINGSFVLFCEQSIWRNGTNVCHARDLVVGDEIYDDADGPVAVTSVELFEDQSLVWYRFDVSGDHSYIIDGLTVHNASRFWVGGTGSLDGSSTTHIASSSGGSTGASYPGSADTMTWDANSGGGTTTVTADHTIQSLIMGAFTGTWDNSANNNNFTLNGNGTSFSGTGTGTRSIKLGSGNTYTISGANGNWNISLTTNLTLTGSAAINFTGNGSRQFQGGSLSYGTVTFGASSGQSQYVVSGANTFAALNITAPNYVLFPQSATQTISSAFNWAGTSSAQIGILSSTNGGTATIAATAGSTCDYCAFRDMSFSGSPTATNSFDLLHNSGITISGPSGGGSSGFGVVGG